MTPGRIGLRQRLLLLALASLAASLLAQTRLSGWVDAQVHDAIARWMPSRPVPENLVLVDIDERSVAELGPWPWPRTVVAEVVRNLRSQGVRLQVWDVFFPEAGAGDSRLQQVLDAADPPDVVFGQVPVFDPKIKDPPREGSLRASADAADFCAEHPPLTGHLGVTPSLEPPLTGHLAATPDPDGRLRSIPAQLCEADRRYPQLVVAAAAAMTPGRAWELREGAFPFGPSRWLRRGDLTFALDEAGRLPVPYHRQHSAWPAVSVSKLLDPQSAAQTRLRGAVVIVGSTALGVGDTASTPHHPRAPGASVHAELMAAALEQNWVWRPRSEALIAAVLVAVLGVALSQGRVRHRGLWLVGGLVLALLAPVLLAAFGRSQGVALPVGAPALALIADLLGVLLLDVGAERRQARRLEAHLESFLPKGLAREIAFQNPSGDSLGKPCHGVLLALRVVGLERWTVSVDSLRALALLHAVNTLAARAATGRGGSLEHVQGETLLLAWPDVNESSVEAAIGTARALFEELPSLLERNESESHPLGIRAAIESGSFLLGVVGSRGSRRPLLIGPVADSVLAMLSLTEELASPILVGGSAAAVRPGGDLQGIGQFLLPDHAHPTLLHRIAV